MQSPCSHIPAFGLPIGDAEWYCWRGYMVASCRSFGSGGDALPENPPPVVRQSLRLVSPSALPRESYALEGLIWLTARFEIREKPNNVYPPPPSPHSSTL